MKGLCCKYVIKFYKKSFQLHSFEQLHQLIKPKKIKQKIQSDYCCILDRQQQKKDEKIKKLTKENELSVEAACWDTSGEKLIEKQG